MNIIYDIETTGLEDNSEVVELAYLAIDDSLNILEFKQSLFSTNNKIPLQSSTCHFITDDDVIGLPKFTESQFTNIFNDSNTIIGYNNIHFDNRVINFNLNWSIPLSNSIDVWRCFYNKFVNNRGDIESFQLTYLVLYFNLLKEVKGILNNKGYEFFPHHAMTDVVMTYCLMKKFMSLFNIQSLNEMKVLSTSPIIMELLPFGKHSGKRIVDILNEDEHYIKWLLNNLLSDKLSKHRSELIYTIFYYKPEYLKEYGLDKLNLEYINNLLLNNVI